MTNSELNDIIQKQHALLLTLQSKCTALEQTLLDYLTTQSPEDSVEICKQYYRHMYEDLRASVSDAEDTSLDVEELLAAKLHELWQLGR